jgi:hypothetical protein
MKILVSKWCKSVYNNDNEVRQWINNLNAAYGVNSK